MINTRVKWVYGISNIDNLNIENNLNKEIEKLEKQYGDIIIKHIEIIPNSLKKDAFIVYEYEEYNNTVDDEVEKIISNDINIRDQDIYFNNSTKEYRKQINILDDYYAIDYLRKNKTNDYNTYHYVKIKDNNKKFLKIKTLEEVLENTTEEIICHYIEKQMHKK